MRRFSLSSAERRILTALPVPAEPQEQGAGAVLTSYAALDDTLANLKSAVQSETYAAKAISAMIFFQGAVSLPSADRVTRPTRSKS
jgi:hypothetical protein